MPTNEKHDNAKARRQERREQLKAQHRRESDDMSQGNTPGAQTGASPRNQGDKNDK